MAVPIGTILAWHRDRPGVQPLLDGFAACNGLPLNDPLSPLNGVTLPALNYPSSMPGTPSGIYTNGLFLRGLCCSGIGGSGSSGQIIGDFNVGDSAGHYHYSNDYLNSN